MKLFKDKNGKIRGRVYKTERGFIVDYGNYEPNSLFCKFFATDSRVMKTEKQAIKILIDNYKLIPIGDKNES